MPTNIQMLRALVEGIKALSQQISAGSTPAIPQGEDLSNRFSMAAVYYTLHNLNLAGFEDSPFTPPGEKLQSAVDPFLKKQGVTLKQLHDMAALNGKYFATLAWNNMRKNPAPAIADENYMLLHKALDSVGIVQGSKEMYDLLGTSAAEFNPIDHAHGLCQISKIIKGTAEDIKDVIRELTEPATSQHQAAMRAMGMPLNITEGIEFDIARIQDWSNLDDITVGDYLKATSASRHALDNQDFRLQ